jgi:hypothetical protein
METNSKDTLSWLHGLEEYLIYKKSPALDYIHDFVSMNYSNDPYVPLKRLIISAHNRQNLDEDDFHKLIDAFFRTFSAIATDSTDEFDFIDWTRISQLIYPEESLFIKLNKYFKIYNEHVAIADAFSRNQIKSKIWLIDELAKIDTNYDVVMVMAGWFGQIKSIYDARLTYRKMRIIELDKQACEVSDYIFNLGNLENYKVKAVNADINNLTLHKNGYEWDVENFKEGTKYGEKFLPDLIINTSAEHMTEEWFNQIRFKEMESNPIVAIQSNNLFEIPDHINCVHSVDHMKKKFPMKEILFEGELQLKGYKRVMLIGRP